MLRPVQARIGSGWGVRRGGDFHSGLDFAAPRGATVVASLPGTVREVLEPGDWRGYGRMIALEHPATPAPLFTLYAHLERALVRVGQAVGAGEPIGTVGDTAGERGERDAHTRAPHLHFELLTRWPPSAPDADRIDPTPHLGLEAGEVSPWPARKRAAAGGALVLLFLAWALSRRAQRKAPSAVARTRRPVPLQRYSEGTA